MLEFENVAAFFLLLLIPTLYFLRFIKLFSGISFPLTLSDWNGSHFIWQKNARNFISAIVQMLTIAGYVCVVIAFANPVVHHQEKIYTSRGADILFVLDTSPSMAARDIADMSRLDAAKQAIHTLAGDNMGDSLGLVEMAQDAVIAVPPTMDHKLFFDKLDAIAIGEMGDGTAIGTALGTAVYHLSRSKATRRCIVLITDGENNAGSIHPNTAARLAKENGITLYVLGVGTKGTVPIEYVDPKTQHVYSGFIESNFDSMVLSNIASVADGKYFGIETMAALSQALGTIGKHEAVVQSYHIRNHDENYYGQFLLAAAILIIAAWLLRRFYLQEIV
jgi:Ca-activated chloride channel family protein